MTPAKSRVDEQTAHPVDECSHAEGSLKILCLLKTKEHLWLFWNRRCQYYFSVMRNSSFPIKRRPYKMFSQPKMSLLTETLETDLSANRLRVSSARVRSAERPNMSLRSEMLENDFLG